MDPVREMTIVVTASLHKCLRQVHLRPRGVWDIPDRDEPFSRVLGVNVVDPYDVAHSRASDSLHRRPAELVFTLPEQVDLVDRPVCRCREEQTFCRIPCDAFYRLREVEGCEEGF